MKFYKKIEKFLDNRFDRIKILFFKHVERKKFKDKRRKAIYSKISLSKEQKRKIDVLYKNNYGKKIPYKWHKHYTAFTGSFDEKYFPELIYIPEFEHFMNYNRRYTAVFADKNVLPFIAKAAGVKTPTIFVSSSKGVITIEESVVDIKTAIEKIKDLGDAFIKPSTDSSSGNGCCLVKFKNGIDVLSGESAEEVFKKAGKNFVIQEVIKCDKGISAIHPESVNTFRVMTYIWKNSIEKVPTIMRIGVGDSVVDNAHKGGIFIAVEDDGTLHKTAFTEFNKKFYSHPNTGIVFDGYKIQGFEKVVAAAKKMHSLIPQVGAINWDFTLNEANEPVLIEANMNSGGIWVFEMAHGKGAFGDKTAEILRWMKSVRKMSKSKRQNYLYGKLPDGEL